MFANLLQLVENNLSSPSSLYILYLIFILFYYRPVGDQYALCERFVSPYSRCGLTPRPTTCAMHINNTTGISTHVLSTGRTPRWFRPLLLVRFVLFVVLRRTCSVPSLIFLNSYARAVDMLIHLIVLDPLALLRFSPLLLAMLLLFLLRRTSPLCSFFICLLILTHLAKQ